MPRPSCRIEEGAGVGGIIGKRKCDTCPIGERIGGRYDFGLLVAGNECGSEDCNG